MNENENRKAPETISYYVHEEEVCRMERQCKRLFIALMVAISLLFLSNIGWLIYESMYDTVSYTQDGAGLNNINTGEQGDIYTDGADTQTESSQER